MNKTSFDSRFKHSNSNMSPENKQQKKPMPKQVQVALPGVIEGESIHTALKKYQHLIPESY